MSNTDATTESPRSVMPAVAGYIVGSIIKAEAPPSPDMIAEFGAIAKALPEDFGFEKIFLGPALKQYEYAFGTPNMSFVIKFASKAKAQEFYELDAYQAWKVKFGVGTSILRDLRIIEAPADIFVAGRAYWLAFIRGQADPERNMKYIGACEVDAHMRTAPWDVTLADGSVQSTSMQLKFVGPSDFKEEAVKLLPAKGSAAATDFFGASTADGIVVIAEFESHAQGAAFKDSLPYKNALLKSLDQTYTTEEAYEASLETFKKEVFQRDVRILGI